MNVSKNFIILVNLKYNQKSVIEFISRCDEYKLLEQLIITIPKLDYPIESHKCKLAVHSDVFYPKFQKIDYFLVNDFLNLSKDIKEIKSQRIKHIITKKNSVIFLGERLEQKVDGLLLHTIINQLNSISKLIEKKKWKNIVLVYKPANNKINIQIIENVHLNIRKWIKHNISDEISNNIKIIYGGKITLKNYEDITNNLNIDGIHLEDDIVFDNLIK